MKIQNVVQDFWKRPRGSGWFDCSVCGFFFFFVVYGLKVNLSLNRWVCRWTFWIKPFPQYLHMCGFSSVWIFTCFLKVEAVVNADPQKSQICFLGRSLKGKNEFKQTTPPGTRNLWSIYFQFCHLFLLIPLLTQRNLPNWRILMAILLGEKIQVLRPSALFDGGTFNKNLMVL